METYLRTFDNYEQNDWTRLLPMAEFAYNCNQVPRDLLRGAVYYLLNRISFK